jgi:hypothetical protein
MTALGANGLHRLVYTSTAAAPLFAESLDRILLRAQAPNRNRGVSGLLLFREGRFLQVLEGEAEAVSELYARIARDRTHRDLIVISNGPCDQRLFGETPLACLPARYFTASQQGALRTLASISREGAAVLGGADMEELLSAFRAKEAA